MTEAQSVFIIDDDTPVREGLCLIIETAGLKCQCYDSAEHFLHEYRPTMQGCIILDVNMPGLSGPELQQELIKRNIHMPIIFLTAHGDIPTTVRAMKDGAFDFLTKPVKSKLLLNRIHEALATQSNIDNTIQKQEDFLKRIERLSDREKEILPLAVGGVQNKEIGLQLGISYRTVEVHRIKILKKTGYSNFVELARSYEAYHHLIR